MRVCVCRRPLSGASVEARARWSVCDESCVEARAPTLPPPPPPLPSAPLL